MNVYALFSAGNRCPGGDDRGPHLLQPARPARIRGNAILTSVADPDDSFFTDPDPDILSKSGSRPFLTHFSKGNNQILGEIFVFNQKSTSYFIFCF